MQSEIVIVDYGMGNLRSVERKVNRVGSKAIITSCKKAIANASKLILPGVGHFERAMKNLGSLDLIETLNKKVIVDKTPILGICLGMQLMADKSEEGAAQGLGWFKSEVVRFSVSNQIKFKIPHIGWNTAIREHGSSLFKDISSDSFFYFVHSYHMICSEPKDILASTSYDYEFVSAINRENIFGVQFHPEKSHDVGEQMVKNFIEL
jgi:imidazole glycerol-phosphate synthase subunit HisH